MPKKFKDYTTDQPDLDHPMHVRKWVTHDVSVVRRRPTPATVTLLKGTQVVAHVGVQLHPKAPTLCEVLNDAGQRLTPRVFALVPNSALSRERVEPISEREVEEQAAYDSSITEFEQDV